MLKLPKSYKQFCGVAKALDVVGERWTLLIVRDLLLGPLRYSDLQRSLVGVTPNLLSKRLRDLAEFGVIRKDSDSERMYSLTELGSRLEPVVLGLGAFGAQFMTEPAKGERLDPRSAALSLKRRFRGAAGEGTLLLHFGEDVFWIHFVGSRLDVRATSSFPGAVFPAPQSEILGEFPAWFPLLSGRKPLKQLLAAGLLSQKGSAKLAEGFVRDLGLLV
jgi:DNA-binding HxlR family transcriptional regulator